MKTIRRGEYFLSITIVDVSYADFPSKSFSLSILLVTKRETVLSCSLFPLSQLSHSRVCIFSPGKLAMRCFSRHNSVGGKEMMILLGNSVQCVSEKCTLKVFLKVWMGCWMVSFALIRWKSVYTKYSVNHLTFVFSTLFLSLVFQ